MRPPGGSIRLPGIEPPILWFRAKRGCYACNNEIEWLVGLRRPAVADCGRAEHHLRRRRDWTFDAFHSVNRVHQRLSAVGLVLVDPGCLRMGRRLFALERW